jgi:hypothetical protein
VIRSSPRTRDLRPTPRTNVVLDADGLSKLARKDRVVREMIRQEVVEGGGRLIVPMIVVVQSLEGGVGDQAVREIVHAAHEATGIDLDRAAEAAGLMRRSGLRDVIDALVAAEALRRVPAIVITSDPTDIRRLLDVHPSGPRVEVWAV